MSNREEYKKKERTNNPLYPYSTPKGYFEDFKSRLMDRIHQEESVEQELPEPQKRPILQVLKPYLYLAAMFVGLALFINLFPRLSRTSPDATEPLATEQRVEVSDEEFEQFLLDDTAEDYWGIVLMESENDLDVMGAR